MKHSHILIAAFALLSFSPLKAQKLTVLHVGGDVTSIVNGKSQKVKVKDVISLQTVVNIPYEGNLDLIDEVNSKRYTIKAIGKGTIATLSANKGNSVTNLTARYLAYVKKQMTNNGLASAQRYSDFATVTREVKKMTMAEKFEMEKKRQNAKFDLFRKQVNDKYNDFVRKTWEKFTGLPAEEKPADEFVKPVKYNAEEETNRIKLFGWVKKSFTKAKTKVEAAFNKPEADSQKQQAGAQDNSSSQNNSNSQKPQASQSSNPNGVVGPTRANVSPVNIPKRTTATDEEKNQVVGPVASLNVDAAIKNQPKPQQDIKEVTLTPQEEEFAYMPFHYLGMDMKVRLDETKRLNIGEISPNRVADALQILATKDYDNLLYDCLQIRKKYKLCDWAYLMMLKEICDQFAGPACNESTLLLGYLYYQSGYMVRFAHVDQELYLLIGTNHTIYGKICFKLDGINFYPVDDMPDQAYICAAKFPNEKELSLFIPQTQEMFVDISEDRDVQSMYYYDFHLKYKSNKELMAFYNNYPSSYVDNNFMTRWAMYANTPMSEDIKSQIYPQIKSQIKGLSKPDAVNFMLSLFGDMEGPGFNYGYDDQVWGGDRAFFAEETLFYPYCDCEDRAILLTRLVRDILGLKCVLVYYPGHLACAVHFDEPVEGDTYELDGVSYVVADPTYVGARLGMEMPLSDNTATLIELQ